MQAADRQTARQKLVELIQAIRPHDALEASQIEATVAWIASGAPLYRLNKANDPPQHLVAYFTLYDVVQQKLLLVDHKKAGLWLPSGGHVEMDEEAQETATRECLEELSVEAIFLSPTPLLLTVTPTVGSVARHTDISLWYLLQGDCRRSLHFDEAEFHQVSWFSLDALPLERADPHLARFTAKLTGWRAY
jgi:8-oxo-dGTP pyrophosphatase MutT (NUDIX family)